MKEQSTSFIKKEPESVIKTEANPRKQIKSFADRLHIKRINMSNSNNIQLYISLMVSHCLSSAK